jgi:hypothetical protein
MFQVVVRLEQRIASEEFNQNATNAPYVAGIAPSEVEYDFGGTIVTRRDN